MLARERRPRRARADAARRGAAHRRHRRRQRRGAARRRTGPGRGRLAGPVVVAGNAEARDEVAAILVAGGAPYVLADNVVPRIGVLAPDGARAAIREMFLAHVIGGKHLSARADFVAMVKGATPDVVLTGVELLARGLDAEHARCRRRRRRGRGRSHHRRALGRRAGPRDRADRAAGCPARWSASTPVTRTVEGDLGHALVGGHHRRRGRARRPGRGRATAPRRPGATCPTTTPRPTSTRPSRAPRSGSRCAGTRAAAGWWSAPRAGWSSAPARTCARSTCWSGRAGCCATGGRASPTGSSPAAPAPTSTAAGSCPGPRGSWWTTTTCSPRSGCWRPTHPEAAYALSAALRGGSRGSGRALACGACPTTPRTVTIRRRTDRRCGARVPPLARPPLSS